MLKFYINEDFQLKQVSSEEVKSCLPQLVWADLFNATLEEEKFVEELLSTEIPTREEMHEIELSSRLYQKHGSLYATATIVTNADTPEPETHALTFVLTSSCLVTVRYVDPAPFRTFLLRAEKSQNLSYQGNVILTDLLEAIIDRMADILEIAGHSIDSTTRKIFNPSVKSGKPKEKADFEEVLQQIGIIGDLVSKTRESLVSVTRLLSYISQTSYFKSSSDEYHRVQTQLRDIPALSDHASFLSNKVNFLLDATLGMISIEQNAIIKIFSVAAVVFLPPTLIASIYGMNFEVMPELKFSFGYPMAIVMMMLSSYLPYKLFKRKGWL
jgi:magnesium transporter